MSESVTPTQNGGDKDSLLPGWSAALEAARLAAHEALWGFSQGERARLAGMVAEPVLAAVYPVVAQALADQIAPMIAEAMRVAIAAEYESGNTYQDEDLSAYDSGIADAEVAVARVRDALRFVAGADLVYTPEQADLDVARGILAVVETSKETPK